ncbi:hypothetical protein BGZ97_006250 [Linnemannia gamsii]|uniref:Uncharacterized protein n=1 Tax=Linnemannia gamsii TaxID=64522 RepID=A0A9P6QRH6_9FUNG|nr:hypothetical protein BGZ97_006250 [Linnemannia gamsii]
MRTSTALLATLLVAVATVSAQEPSASQPEKPLPCYEQTCRPLINALAECKITVDTTTGNINFPSTPDPSGTTDKCLCKQSIVDAYDPCYTCGAGASKIQDRFSTLSLVNSCNTNFGANTVIMPGSKPSSASSVRAGSLAATVVAVASVAFMVLA